MSRARSTRESSSSGVVAGSSSSTDVLGYLATVGESPALDQIDRVAVDVSQLIGLAGGEGGTHSADQFASDCAGGLDVVMTSLANQPVAEGGELGVGLASHVGGPVEGFCQDLTCSPGSARRGPDRT